MFFLSSYIDREVATLFLIPRLDYLIIWVGAYDMFTLCCRGTFYLTHSFICYPLMSIFTRKSSGGRRTKKSSSLLPPLMNRCQEGLPHVLENEEEHTHLFVVSFISEGKWNFGSRHNCVSCEKGIHNQHRNTYIILCVNVVFLTFICRYLDMPKSYYKSKPLFYEKCTKTLRRN